MSKMIKQDMKYNDKIKEIIWMKKKITMRMRVRMNQSSNHKV
jgi:hypothetical protein